MSNYNEAPFESAIEISLSEHDKYIKWEVLSYVPDAWVDESKTKVGYEIFFNRYFYVYNPPRILEEIQSNLTSIKFDIENLLKEGIR